MPDARLTLICPSTGTEWTLVPGRAAAIQGHTSEPVMVRVRNEDIYSNPTGGTSVVHSAHWVSTGPDAALTRSVNRVGEHHEVTVYSWVCGDDHGHTLASEPRLRRVPCTRCGTQGAPRGYNMSGGPSGMRQVCSCCNGSGTHPADNVPCAI